jgi:hypothetical protein
MSKTKSLNILNSVSLSSSALCKSKTEKTSYLGAFLITKGINLFKYSSLLYSKPFPNAFNFILIFKLFYNVLRLALSGDEPKPSHYKYNKTFHTAADFP